MFFLCEIGNIFVASATVDVPLHQMRFDPKAFETSSIGIMRQANDVLHATSNQSYVYITCLLN